MKGWQEFPYMVDVKAGEKCFFCTCGKSAKGPYCDGAHKGTEFKPNVVEFDKEQRVRICGCLESKKGHLCDGSHNGL